MDAQQYDEAGAHRRQKRTIAIVIIALFLAWVGYHFRNYPERRAADQFLAALQRGDVEDAYGLWLKDPNWKQHPQKYSQYNFGDFSEDWGPSGEWGIIKSHRIDCSLSRGSGVIVQATVNDRAESMYIWVDKGPKTLHFSPDKIECGDVLGWMTE